MRIVSVLLLLLMLAPQASWAKAKTQCAKKCETLEAKNQQLEREADHYRGRTRSFLQRHGGAILTGVLVGAAVVVGHKLGKDDCDEKPACPTCPPPKKHGK